MAEFEKVAKVSDIGPGEAKVVQAAGHDVALFNADGKFYAIDNVCKHQGGPLGEGMLQGTEVTCPWHGWTYDVTNGQCTMNPGVSVACLKVKVEGDDVHVSA